MLKNAKYEPRVLYFKLTAFESAPGRYEGKERELEEDNFMRAADHNLHAQTDHDSEEEDIEYADPMPLPEMKSEKHAGFVQPIQSVGSDLMPMGFNELRGFAESTGVSSLPNAEPSLMDDYFFQEFLRA